MKKKFTLSLTCFLAAMLFLSFNVIGQYGGTGTFTKITSIDDLEDGYYVIAELNEEFAMNVANDGSFFKHTAISPVSNEITNPANDIVWKIEADGDYFTISNIDGATVTYVSYSGSSNAAYAVENPASISDNERWTIEYNDRFEVTNVAVDTRELQYNAGAPRFACYTTNQRRLSFFKLDTEAAIPPIISNIIQSPEEVTSDDAVSVSADVTEGDAAIANVELHWNTDNDFDTYTTISMSLDAGDTYITDSDIPDQDDGVTVYYRVYAEDVEEESSISAVQNYTVRDPRLTALPYSEDFENDLGDLYVFTTEGSQPWSHNAGGEWVEANGHGGDPTEHHWLILPGINMDDYDEVEIIFDLWWRWGSDDENNYLKLHYSTDYAGVGDPGEATWNDLAFDKPDTDQDWQSSGIIDLSAIEGESVWLAFEYYSTDDPRRWQIDNIEVYDASDPLFSADPESLSGLDYTEYKGPSDSQSFELTGENLEPGDAEITITAPANFQVSLDDSDFSELKTVNATDGSLSQTVYVRLAAELTPDDYSGNVEITGGGADQLDVAVNGNVKPAGYFVDFESPGETKTAYASGTVNLSGLDWNMTEALIGTSGTDLINGLRSARMRGYAESSMSMLEDKSNGIGVVTFKYRRYGTDAQVDWKVEYSTDGGTDWTQIGSDFTAPATDDVQTFYEVVNVAGDARIRIKRATEEGSANRRLNIDDILITNYVEWTGSEDNDWHSADNWNGDVPDSGIDAVIPSGLANYPTIDAPATVRNITLESGASLIDNENLSITGEFIMQREIIAAGDWSGEAVDWHMISSPVANQAIEGVWTPEGGDGDYDFYAYDEPSKMWLNEKNPDNSALFDPGFIPAKGYLVAYEQTDIKEFSGAINTGDIIFTLSASGDGDDDGWNLMGNPYPSAIDWNEADRTNFESDYVYIYNRAKGGGAGYEEIDGDVVNAFIPANQGFFVEVSLGNDGETFTFRNAMRVHGDDFMKSQTPESELLKLRLTKDNYYDETTIRIEAGSEFERDRRDARKLFSFAGYVPQLYSFTSDRVNVAINTIPEVDEERSISLGMRIPANGEYTLSVQEIAESFTGSNAKLLDNKTGKIHDLSQGFVYNFIAEEGDDEERFEIVFGKQDDATDITEPSEIAVDAWYYNNRLHVVSDEDNTKVAVFDINGRKLHSFNAEAGQQSYSLDLPAGVYIVRTTAQSATKSVKIVIQ